MRGEIPRLIEIVFIVICGAVAILQNGKLARASEKHRHVMISIKQGRGITIRITKAMNAMRYDRQQQQDNKVKGEMQLKV